MESKAGVTGIRILLMLCFKWIKGTEPILYELFI